MNINKELLITILIASALLMLFLAVVTLSKRKTSGSAAIYLGICLVAVSFYSFGYAKELGSITLEEVMKWVRFQHWGIEIVSPAWLLFALVITGRKKLITTTRIILLLIIPFCSFLAAQTLGGLNLAHINPHLDTYGSLSTFHYDKGLVTTVNFFYVNFCLVTALVLFSIMIFKTYGTIRAQAIVFWIGALVPFIGQVIYNAGASVYHLDLTPITLTISSIVLAIGFFEFHLLDIVPLAHDVIFDSLGDGLLVLDTQNRIIDVNPRLTVMLTEVSKKSIGKTISEILSAHPAFCEFASKNTEGIYEFEVKETRKINSYLATLAPVLDKRKRSVGKILTLHDNTQTKHLFNQLEELATRDSLTGAYNRRSFDQLSEQIILDLQVKGGKFSMIMLDLDHFKLANDNYSHTAGDVVLKKVTETCRSLIRLNDILGRYGGDEFLIFLPEIEAHDALVIAERLRTGIELEQITSDDVTFTITASLGVTNVVCPDDFSLEDVFHCADQAVYDAKNKGRNQVSVCNLDQMKRISPN